jgi:hypothetical protein
METALAAISLLGSLVAVILSFRKQRKLTLEQAAAMGVDSAAQLIKEPKERLAFALDVARKLDLSADSKRDWSDAQIRLAVESEVARRKAGK